MDVSAGVLPGVLATAGVAGLLIAFAARARQVESAPSAVPEAAPADAGQRAERAVASKPRVTRPETGRRSQRERLAAAVAEQIKDVLHASLLADPLLAERDVDLGTAADGSLEIVDGETYTEVSHIPDKRIREALARAVAEWQGGKRHGGES